MSDYTWHIPDPQTQPEFYADIPMKRLLAFLVDAVPIVFASLLIVPFTGFAGLFFFPLLALGVGFFYRTATIARWSATPGMLLVAIEFRTLSGERFDANMAALHSGIFTGAWLFLPLQFGSALLMMTGPRAQGLADHMLGTVAINRPAPR